MRIKPRTFLRKVVRKVLRRPDAATAAAAQFWDHQITERESVYWTAYPQVREYLNELITGVPWLWPLTALKAGWTYRPLKRSISIGCGTGPFEREVRNFNVSSQIIGFDISKASIREARRLARKAGLDGITYHARDCNQLSLPRNHFDGAFFHASLHHIADPDRLLDEVNRALVPEGLVYVDDYVGPSRDEWSDAHLVHAREVFDTLPDELKLRPLGAPFDYRDPSEMIRSSRTLPALREKFEIIHDRPYWGNLLYPVLSHVDGVLMQQPQYAGTLARLIATERELVARGEFTDPLFAVVLARKRA